MTVPKASHVIVTRADGSQVILQARGRSRRQVSVRFQRDVFARDGKCCRYCGYKHHDVGRFVIDHVKPVALGGCDELSNLVVACARCNRAKGTHTWRPLSVKGAQSISTPIPLRVLIRSMNAESFSF